ncbi:MAG: hypothetical protein Q4A11_05910, partial [Brachymonas sp.]|nr:hypothetical protein [Brachymonas sp.]
RGTGRSTTVLIRSPCRRGRCEGVMRALLHLHVAQWGRSVAFASASAAHVPWWLAIQGQGVRGHHLHQSPAKHQQEEITPQNAKPGDKRLMPSVQA